MRIVVIGSGFGGLAAALRMQAQGHDVKIVEALDQPGGCAGVFAQDGFTFDAGPTILTAPWLVDELFALARRRTADYVKLVPMVPFYNVRFEDGSVFRYSAEPGAVEREVERFNPADVDGYRRFRQASAEIFRAGFALIDQPFLTLRSMLRVLPDLIRLRADRSVAQVVDRFITDDRLRQVFSFHPLLVGGNPFRTTNIYTLIHHLEQKWGVWFPMGGMGALVRALVRLFEDLGGTLMLGATVSEIVIDARSRRATGVRLVHGEIVPADAVVSNADVATTYMRLVPAVFRGRNTDARLARMEYSMSLFVLYFGTDRQYPGMAHHEILMGPRYRGLLEDVFQRKVLARDFSLYLHRPTATDPSLAPPGHDAWYVLSPVPHLGGATDWSTAARPYRDAIVAYLGERYLPGLAEHIVTERIVDPRYFRDRLGSHLGSAFSIQPTLMQSAWMRPHNRSEDVPNLYFAGAGTHPGAGLPGVISSGKIVADLIGPASEARVSPPTKRTLATARGDLDEARSRGDRVAWALLAAHLAVISFSTAALVTILAGEFPVWLQGDYTARVYRIGWTFSGPTYVVLGALAAFAHSSGRLGGARAVTVLVLASALALASELLGTNIGIPFGPYHYTPMLGYMINGDVPFPIPISWYYMLYACLAIVGRLLVADDASGGRWRWAIAAGLILTAWDVPQDPAMTAVQPAHWVWDYHRFAVWTPAVLKTGFFHGMPLSNWIGWLVTGTLVARAMLSVVPPTVVRDLVSPARLPIALYAVNGIMPIAICARHRLWLGAILGAVLMGTPVWLAVRAPLTVRKL